MISNYHMPTRIVAGAGSLATLGRLARDLGMTRVLVVSDPVISVQPFHADALAALGEAGMVTARFDECGIDARCSHIDAQGERVRRDGIDGVVCIGGGSVMCTGKGIAIVATNRRPMAECTGVGQFDKRALPMIKVPTTAGSGSEVSQWTIVKDEERHLKLLGGGPLSFPDIAILDAVTLRSLPMRVAALPAVDALTHAVEAYVSGIGSHLTDAIALGAVRLQFGSLRASINSDDERAREDIRHDPGLPFQVRGPAGIKRLADALLPGIPDLALSIEDVIAEGGKVLVRLRVIGTHGGELMGMAPTGRKIDIGVMDLFHVRGGTLVEHWALLDNLGMLKQLGVTAI